MNKNTIATMLRCNKPADVVAVVMALPEPMIVSTIGATVELHNAQPTVASMQFLEAIVALRPNLVRVE